MNNFSAIENWSQKLRVGDARKPFAKRLVSAAYSSTDSSSATEKKVSDAIHKIRQVLSYFQSVETRTRVESKSFLSLELGVGLGSMVLRHV